MNNILSALTKSMTPGEQAQAAAAAKGAAGASASPSDDARQQLLAGLQSAGYTVGHEGSLQQQQPGHGQQQGGQHGQE